MLYSGYIRILLLLVGWWYFHYPPIFVFCYVLSITLDGFDGYAARRLNQTSEFGAWFDVVVDNLGRSMLWNLLYEWGHFITSLEWCVFVCTHNSMGAEWKKRFDRSPWWAQSVMANGFKTPAGAVAIAGLHVLPIWLYGYEKEFLTEVLLLPIAAQQAGIVILVVGRLLCFPVEIWCLWIHIMYLTDDRKETKNKD
uniref:Uncharacterized protein n=1 Tax=Callorhinchus milii TaxID=7868 RepID=A0A4W3JYX9_CALMI|eukprot:gi/632958048/ref/XP_007894815.1/ PREDICTED: CDP-diacylglycerol--inositol 3-phosphatidyltransferase [Callorhinchus milii]